MKLSILVPVYNEANIIGHSLPLIFESLAKEEIIIINDGSTDKTSSVLNNLSQQYNFKLLNLKPNQGKGRALQAGIKQATGDWIVFLDADLEYSPQDTRIIWQKIKQKPNLNFTVFGSRFKNQKIVWQTYWLANYFLTWLTNFLFGSKLTDMETCLKFIPANILKSLKLNSRAFEIEPEITAKLLKKSISIIELPISYNRRNYEQGKKIRAYDGLLAIKMLFKERLSN